MPFIPPMLVTRLEDPRRLADPRYIAEPKLDGQRAQINARASHRPPLSRSGRELITLSGLAWLREIPLARLSAALALLHRPAPSPDQCGSRSLNAVIQGIKKMARGVLQR
jgi:hypothetical protein